LLDVPAGMFAGSDTIAVKQREVQLRSITRLSHLDSKKHKYTSRLFFVFFYNNTINKSYHGGDEDQALALPRRQRPER